MKYIAHRRFKDKGICGPVNIPATSELETAGEMLLWEGKPICMMSSENAHQHFARDDDGKGLERGKLTQAIRKTLGDPDDQKHQDRWDRVWDDALCQQYKREEYGDYWLWNHAFYNAPIGDLEHILKLVKGA